MKHITVVFLSQITSMVFSNLITLSITMVVGSGRSEAVQLRHGDPHVQHTLTHHAITSQNFCFIVQCLKGDFTYNYTLIYLDIYRD